MTLEQDVVRLRDTTTPQPTFRQIARELGIDRNVCYRTYLKATGKPLASSSPIRFELRAMAAMTKKTDWVSQIEQAKREMLDDIRAEARERPTPLLRIPRDVKQSGVLVEVAPVDLHVGKLAWGEETGGPDYDVRIAERVFCSAIQDIISRTSHLKPERFALVVGNDLLQTDSSAGTTTAGTVVDTDSRWVKSFRRARSINSWAIRELATTAPVTVVIVPGNHDAQSAWCLGEVLAAEFADDPRVTIDNSPRPRKYLRWGINLLGWTHGNDEPHASLPLIMAQERPQEWAETTWREWHTGHLHKVREVRFTAGDSFNGVRVRVLPSLCSPDAWHSRRGYITEQRACEAYLWDREKGYAGHLSSNVDPDQVAA